MICPNCGKEIAMQSMFCHHCGCRIPYAPVKEQKKNKWLIPVIAFSGVFLVVIGIFAVLIFNGTIQLGKRNMIDNNRDGYNPGSNSQADNIAADNSIKDINTDKKAEEIKPDENKSSANTPKDGLIYDFKYSYTEIPDVLSLDSDTRFIYDNYYSENGFSVYSYQFDDVNASEEDFIQACDDYSVLLQELSGFTYDKEYGDQHYEYTGERANYLFREDYGIAISVAEEPSSYVNVTIFPIGGEIENGGEAGGYDLPNYETYLANREIQYFTYEETVNMDNGLSFYVYDVTARYPGDGTMSVDVIMDLSSYYTDYYTDNGDFMLLPVDGEGNLISDAIPISYVTDSLGNQMTMPYLVSASSYEQYTFTYQVPPNTMAFSIYATNLINNDYSAPVYVMEVGYN